MRPSAGQAVQNHAQHHNADTQKSHRPGQRIPAEEDGSMSIVGVEPINNGKDVILSDDILAVWHYFSAKAGAQAGTCFCKEGKCEEIG